MPRYVSYWTTHSNPWGPSYGEPISAREVIETDKTPERTGLLDQHGDPIYRVPDTVPFGFRGKA